MSAYKRVANLRAARKKGFNTGIEANPFDISGVGWSTLENKFHELMELMDVPVNGISALEARAQHREKVASVIVSLLDRAQEECRRLLVEGNAEAAEEAGVKVLHLRVLFYGENKLELVPAYLHLARTKQFLELYGDAEDMLSLAHFIVLHHQDKVSMSMKAELHQTFGLLYAADEKLDAAVSHLSCATYYLSGIHGPENILTSFSYFDLGNVFAAKASMENAMALYDTVKEIWYTHLMKVLQEIVEKKAEAEKLKKYEDEDEVHEAGYASARAFGAENRTDTSKMLYGIYGIQRERFRVAHPSTARAAFVLGLFLLWIDDVPEASKFLREARNTSMQFYGSAHPVVQEIEEWSNLFEVSLQEEEESGSSEDEEALEDPVALEKQVLEARKQVYEGKQKSSSAPHQSVETHEPESSTKEGQTEEAEAAQAEENVEEAKALPIEENTEEAEAAQAEENAEEAEAAQGGENAEEAEAAQAEENAEEAEAAQAEENVEEAEAAQAEENAEEAEALPLEENVEEAEATQAEENAEEAEAP